MNLFFNLASKADRIYFPLFTPIEILKHYKNSVQVPLIVRKKNHPIKIVTGKENCAIIRIETSLVQKLLTSLEKDKHYSEFIILSPFTKDGIELSRILFLDGDYVKRNEKYLGR